MTEGDVGKRGPFCVDYAQQPVDDVITKWCQTLSAAMKFAERISHKYPCVWIGEMGVYRALNGKDVRDWIYFWWTEGTEYGPMSGRGWGYPYEEPDDPKEYVSVKESLRANKGSSATAAITKITSQRKSSQPTARTSKIGNKPLKVSRTNASRQKKQNAKR